MTWLDRLYASKSCNLELSLAYFVVVGGLLAAALFSWGQHGYVVPSLNVVADEPTPYAEGWRIHRSAPPPADAEVHYIAVGEAISTLLQWQANALAGNPKAHIPEHLSFFPGQLVGHRTQAVSGDLRTLSALNAMLRNSGLTWRVTDHGQVIEVAVQGPSQPEDDLASRRASSSVPLFWIQWDDLVH